MTNDFVASGGDVRLAPDGAYQPGVCNIGPAEIRRRRMTGHVGLVAAVGLLALLALAGAPPWMRLLAIAPATLSASGYVQARMRFCAHYGWRGIFNVGEIGDDMRVDDRAARAADRRRALRIGLVSFAIGLAAGVVAAVLPI